MRAFMNRAEVQEALHASVTHLKFDWEPCSDVIPKWGDSPHTILPLLHELLSHGFRIWVFRGKLIHMSSCCHINCTNFLFSRIRVNGREIEIIMVTSIEIEYSMWIW